MQDTCLHFVELFCYVSVIAVLYVVFVSSKNWQVLFVSAVFRHLVLSKDREDKSKSKDHIRYQYDEHYFLTDPDEFIQVSTWHLLTLV